MKLAQYPLDETFGTDACLRALAEQYGTPLLVYDRKTLENRVRMLQKAFAWAPDFRQLFPVKAVANPAVLDKIMVDYYGSPTAINQLAAISVTEART